MKLKYFCDQENLRIRTICTNKSKGKDFIVLSNSITINRC